MNEIRIYLSLVFILALSNGCSKQGSDSERVTLRQVTGSTVEDSSSDASSRSAVKEGQRKRPRINECRADAATFCENEAFPDSVNGPLTEEQRKSLFQCLKANSADLSPGCKDQLARLPKPPGDGETSGPKPRKRFLPNCGEDAKRLAGDILPTQAKFRELTQAEKLEVLTNVIARLSENSESLNDSCKNELGVSDGSEPETASGS